MEDMLDKLEAGIVRRLTPKLGAERAQREAPQRVRLALVMLVWVILAAAHMVLLALGSSLRLALDLLILAWTPIVVLSLVRFRRATKA